MYPDNKAERAIPTLIIAQHTHTPRNPHARHTHTPHTPHARPTQTQRTPHAHPTHARLPRPPSLRYRTNNFYLSETNFVVFSPFLTSQKINVAQKRAACFAKKIEICRNSCFCRFSEINGTRILASLASSFFLL